MVLPGFAWDEQESHVLLQQLSELVPVLDHEMV